MESLPQLLASLVESITLLNSVPYVFWIAIGSLLVVGFAMTFAGLATYAERKISADLQSRIGPTRVGPHNVGPFAIFQWVADGIKFLLKEDIIPSTADRFLHKIAPVIVAAAALAAFAVLPFADGVVMSNLNIGILYISAVSSILALGILLGGWGSGNKWSLLGGMRSAAQIVSYEIPIFLTILSVVLVVGSLNLTEIINGQSPTSWYLFHNPFIFINFFIFLVAGLAETNRTPFDIPEAESELVQGYNTEYSGMRFALFFLGEYVEVYVICALAVILFFGGWHLPFIDISGIEQPLRGVIQALSLMTKSVLLFFVMIWLRWTLPRYRVDQLMDVCWKYLTPIAFVNLLGTALWVLLFKGQSLLEVIF